MRRLGLRRRRPPAGVAAAAAVAEEEEEELLPLVAPPCAAAPRRSSLPGTLARTRSGLASRLVGMGFEPEQTMCALERTQFHSVERAVEWLLAENQLEQQPVLTRASTAPAEVGKSLSEALPPPSSRRQPPATNAEGTVHLRRVSNEVLQARTATFLGLKPQFESDWEPEPETDEPEPGEPECEAELEPRGFAKLSVQECAICYADVYLRSADTKNIVAAHAATVAAAHTPRTAREMQQDFSGQFAPHGSPPCGHYFHTECWAGWFNARINDGNVSEICCPSCTRRVTPAEVANVVEPAMFEKFERFLQAAELASDPEVRWCPKQGCAAAIHGWERWPPMPAATEKSAEAGLLEVTIVQSRHREQLVWMGYGLALSLVSTAGRFCLSESTPVLPDSASDVVDIFVCVWLMLRWGMFAGLAGLCGWASLQPFAAAPEVLGSETRPARAHAQGEERSTPCVRVVEVTMEWIWMVQHELRLLWLEMTLRGDERGLTCQLWLLQTPARWLSGLTADNACAEPLSFVALGQRIGRTVSRQYALLVAAENFDGHEDLDLAQQQQRETTESDWWGKKSVCPECATAICFDCLEPFHEGLRCEEVESARVMQWAGGRDARTCPGCRTLIERRDGCNHMTCRCGHEFCWLCGEDYVSGHFQNSSCQQYGGVPDSIDRALEHGPLLRLWLPSLLYCLLWARIGLACILPRVARWLSSALGSASGPKWLHLIALCFSIPFSRVIYPAGCSAVRMEQSHPQLAWGWKKRMASMFAVVLSVAVYNRPAMVVAEGVFSSCAWTLILTTIVMGGGTVLHAVLFQARKAARERQNVAVATGSARPDRRGLFASVGEWQEQYKKDARTVWVLCLSSQMEPVAVALLVWFAGLLLRSIAVLQSYTCCSWLTPLWACQTTFSTAETVVYIAMVIAGFCTSGMALLMDLHMVSNIPDARLSTEPVVPARFVKQLSMALPRALLRQACVAAPYYAAATDSAWKLPATETTTTPYLSINKYAYTLGELSLGPWMLPVGHEAYVAGTRYQDSTTDVHTSPFEASAEWRGWVASDSLLFAPLLGQAIMWAVVAIFMGLQHDRFGVESPTRGGKLTTRLWQVLPLSVSAVIMLGRYLQCLPLAVMQHNPGPWLLWSPDTPLHFEPSTLTEEAYYMPASGLTDTGHRSSTWESGDLVSVATLLKLTIFAIFMRDMNKWWTAWARRRARIQTFRALWNALSMTSHLLCILWLYWTLINSSSGRWSSTVATASRGNLLPASPSPPPPRIELEVWLARELSGQSVAVELAGLSTAWEPRGQCTVLSSFLHGVEPGVYSPPHVLKTMAFSADSVALQLRLGGFSSLQQLVTTPPTIAAMRQLAIPTWCAVQISRSLERTVAAITRTYDGNGAGGGRHSSRLHVAEYAYTWSPRSWCSMFYGATYSYICVILIGVLVGASGFHWPLARWGRQLLRWWVAQLRSARGRYWRTALCIATAVYLVFFIGCGLSLLLGFDTQFVEQRWAPLVPDVSQLAAVILELSVTATSPLALARLPIR